MYYLVLINVFLYVLFPGVIGACFVTIEFMWEQQQKHWNCTGGVDVDNFHTFATLIPPAPEPSDLTPIIYRRRYG